MVAARFICSRSWEGGPLAGGEPHPQHDRGAGDREAGDARVPPSPRRLGQPLERVLDRLAELLERGTASAARLEAGVDDLGELAGQVGTRPSQGPGAVAYRPRGRRRGGAAVRVLTGP